MRSVLAYTAARLLIFAATAALLKLLLPLDYDKSPGQSNLLLLALAVLISGIVSYVLLSRQREAMSSAVVEGVRKQRGRLSDKVEQARTKEDPKPSGEEGASSGEGAPDPAPKDSHA